MYTTSYRRQLMSGNLLAASYPLLSNLNNTVQTGSASATFSRSAAKNHVAQDGSISVYAVNTPAYMSSGIQLENVSADYCRYDDFSTGWSNSYYASETRVLDPIGTSDALHIVSNATSNIDLNRLYASGFSNHSNFSVYAKSNTNWLKIVVGDSVAITHGVGVWIDLASNTFGTIVSHGTLFTITNPVVTNAPNGYKRIQFQCNNLSNTQLQIDFFNVSGNGSNTYTPGDTLTLWNVDGLATPCDSLIYTPSSGLIYHEKDYLYIPTTRLPTNNYSTYFEWTFKYASLATEAYLYFEGDGAINSTTNETSVKYNKTTHDWTLTVKRSGTSHTAVVNYSVSLTYLIKVFFKVSSSGIYLEVNGNSSTGSGASTGYHASNIWLNAKGESLGDYAPTGTLANFRVARSTQLTRAEVESL